MKMNLSLRIWVFLLLGTNIVMYVSCDSYYITWSYDDTANHCPERLDQDHCMTLPLFAYHNRWLSSNTTLEFESGNHYLNGHISASGFDFFSVMADNATITCQNYNDGFLLDNIGYIHISGINFLTCRVGVSARPVRIRAKFVLEDSNFQQYGSRVELGGIHNATILRSTFSNTCCANTIHSTWTILYIKLCTFSNISVASAINSGGPIHIDQSTFKNIRIARAIYSDSGTIIVNRCSFINNSRTAIYALSTVSTIINQSTFINNAYSYRSDNGTAVYSRSRTLQITNSTFVSNKASYCGGAVYVSYVTPTSPSAVTVEISNCKFINNTASECHGGALYVATDNSSVTMTSNVFSGNSANDGSGGTVYLGGNNISISSINNTFSSNSAASCGVLYANKFGNVNFTASTFTHNRASGQYTIDSRGGVACIINSSMSISNSTFEHNGAIGGNGGVLFVDDSIAEIHGSVFGYNLAEGDGGVMFVQGTSRPSQVRVIESDFGYNHATENGGVVTINGSVLEFYQTEIYNNTADLGGFIINACDSNVTVSDELFYAIDSDHPVCFQYDNIESVQNQMTTTANEVITTRSVEASTTTGSPVIASTTTTSPTETSSTNTITSGSPLDSTTTVFTNEAITTSHSSTEVSTTTVTASPAEESTTSHSVTEESTTTGSPTTGIGATKLTTSPIETSTTTDTSTTTTGYLPETSMQSTSTGSPTEANTYYTTHSLAELNTQSTEAGSTTYSLTDESTTGYLPEADTTESNSTSSPTEAITTDGTSTQETNMSIGHFTETVTTKLSTSTGSPNEEITTTDSSFASGNQKTTISSSPIEVSTDAIDLPTEEVLTTVHSTVASEKTGSPIQLSTSQTEAITTTTFQGSTTYRTDSEVIGTTDAPTDFEATGSGAEAYTSSTKVSQIYLLTSGSEDIAVVATNASKGAKPQMKLIIIVTVTVSIVLILVTLCIVLLVYCLFKRKAKRWPLNNNSRSYTRLLSGEMDSVGGQPQPGEELLAGQQDTTLGDENEL